MMDIIKGIYVKNGINIVENVFVSSPSLKVKNIRDIPFCLVSQELLSTRQVEAVGHDVITILASS